MARHAYVSRRDGRWSCHHHAVHDVLLDHLSDFKPEFISGRQMTNVRDTSQKRFEDGETNLCIIAPRAATGLDGLQKRARVVAFAELDWSLAVHKQDEDRARISWADCALIERRQDHGCTVALRQANAKATASGANWRRERIRGICRNEPPTRCRNDAPTALKSLKTMVGDVGLEPTTR